MRSDDLLQHGSALSQLIFRTMGAQGHTSPLRTMKIVPAHNRTTNQVHHALNALERLKDSKLRELRAVERAIQELAETMLIGYGRGEPKSCEYMSVGIADAARHCLGQIGTPQSTREIAEALIDRGITTKSRRFVSTVYATLAHAKEFQRTSDGRWILSAQE